MLTTNESNQQYIEPLLLPELAESAQLDEELQKGVCPWLDDYIKFATKWSPRSFPGYHIGCGLWILSAIAARRVYIDFPVTNYTNLYIILVGKTSTTGKTSAAQIAIKVLKKANLDFLLVPDTITPQALIKEMSLTLPDGYNHLTKAEREQILSDRAFSGQRAWCYDEMGQLVTSMQRSGPMEDFSGLLRRLVNTPDHLSNSTIARGYERVINPYLTFMGILTPDDIRCFAGKGNKNWGNGFLARYAVIVPPGDYLNLEKLPNQSCEIPSNIVEPLKEWHTRLGIPVVGVVDGQLSYCQDFPKQTIRLSNETYDAFYRYMNALLLVSSCFENEDLRGSYARLPISALHVAALFASLSYSSTIELTHWAKAQAIAETWRQYLHDLYNSMVIGQNRPRDKYEKVLSIIETKGEFSSRDIQAYTKLRANTVETILQELIQAGYIDSYAAGRKTVYKIKDSHPPFSSAKYLCRNGGVSLDRFEMFG